MNSSRWLLLFFLLLDIFVLLFGDIAYGTKDDVRILQLLSGTMLCSEPTAFIMYPNILVGVFLKSLYLLWPNVPWYFLFLSTFLIIAHLVSIAVVSRHKGVPFAAVTGIAFYLFFYQITFTATSILIAFAGYSILFDAGLRNGKGFFGRLMPYLIAALMFLAAVSIRPETFFFASVFGSFSLLIALGIRRFLKEMAPFLVIVFLFSASLPAFDIMQYDSSGGNSEFAKYNKYKTFIVDFDVGEHSENFDEALAKVGWSPNDYELFHAWLFLKNEVFSLQNLKNFVEFLEISYDSKTPDLIVFYERLMRDPYVIVVFVLFSLCLLLYGKSAAKRALTMFLFVNLVFVGVTLTMKMPPPRLYLPVFYFILVLILLYTDDREAARFRWTPYLLLSVSAGFFFVFAQIAKQNDIRRTTHLKYVQQLEKERFYLSVDDALMPTGVDPRSDLAYLKGFKVVPFGTVVILGEVERFMHENGFDDYDALFESENVRLLFPRKSLWKIELLRNYLLEHYSVRVEAEVRKGTNDLYIVGFIPLEKAFGTES
ncbi:hypothetical protein [Hydrogenimonas cancrithermarum]|uniref:Glycosyltransferase RgtA/B/C/D-like domain-containing protein n=1 Tax=Hydrogenimonas cancrithermarum TaxID=2993563 RepID=A0ABM8FMG7_9BACT|nr:hypothetical protein [Hydrogenimonas cancrithermarum]BDY13568.1 hypothetical protein HCR_18800 [Hydrogenimonas cancrithermarum]